MADILVKITWSDDNNFYETRPTQSCYFKIYKRTDTDTLSQLFSSSKMIAKSQNWERLVQENELNQTITSDDLDSLDVFFNFDSDDVSSSDLKIYNYQKSIDATIENDTIILNILLEIPSEVLNNVGDILININYDFPDNYIANDLSTLTISPKYVLPDPNGYINYFDPVSSNQSKKIGSIHNKNSSPAAQISISQNEIQYTYTDCLFENHNLFLDCSWPTTLSSNNTTYRCYYNRLIPVWDETNKILTFNITVICATSDYSVVQQRITWQDKNNLYEKRPSQITAKITSTSSSTILAENILSNNNQWQWYARLYRQAASNTKTILPNFESNVYTLVGLPSRGQTLFASHNIKLRYTGIFSDVLVKIDWKDNNNINETRPSLVKIGIISDNNTIDYLFPYSNSSLSNLNLIESLFTLSDENQWQYLISDISVVNNDPLNVKVVYFDSTSYTSNNIEYTCIVSRSFEEREEENDLYILTLTCIQSNSFNHLIKINWEDENNLYETRPSQLYLETGSSSQTKSTIELSDNNEWEYLFSNMSVPYNCYQLFGYDGSYMFNIYYFGESSTYNSEDEFNWQSYVWGYEYSLEENDENSLEYTWVTTITFKYIVTNTGVHINWQDANDYDNQRPSPLAAHLIRTPSDNPSNEYIVETVQLTADNNWSYDFNELPYYTYLIDETQISENIPVYVYSIIINSNNNVSGYDLISSEENNNIFNYTYLHNPSKKILIDIKVNWKDTSFETLRPNTEESFVINLTENTDANILENKQTDFVFNSSENSFHWTVSQIPLFYNGEEILYEINYPREIGLYSGELKRITFSNNENLYYEINYSIQNSNFSTWINKISYTKDLENSEEEKIFNIGTTFDQVRYSEENTFTLKDFVDIIKEFFMQPMFMKYSEDEPKNESVKEWYQLITNSEELSEEDTGNNS